VGDAIWVSDVWRPASYDVGTGIFKPGRLLPGSFAKIVIHGPRFD
jgi:hypothetical protein